ncbi:MAG TPA: AraC family transcriptional regulator [Capsulimonadaceae bacterium]|jgi:AraC-like DNA-binding protein
MDTILLPNANRRVASTFVAPSFFLSSLKVAKYRYRDTNQYDGRIGTPHYSLGYVLKGHARFASERECFDLTSGDFVFVPKGERYVSDWIGSPDIEYWSIHFLFNPIDQIGDVTRAVRRYKLQKVTGWDNSIKNKFDEIHAAYAEGGDSMLIALGNFYLIYRDLVNILAFDDVPMVKNPVQAAVNYIESHHTEEFHVADLAALCAMSESRFYGAFLQAVGCTPIGYKNRVRIQHAVELLTEHENTVEKISSVLNFSSPAYFRRVFKQVTGRTPRESRYSL